MPPQPAVHRKMPMVLGLQAGRNPARLTTIGIPAPCVYGMYLIFFSACIETALAHAHAKGPRPLTLI